MKGHVKLELCVGEEAPTPMFKAHTGNKKLVMEDMVRVRVSGRFKPSLLDHLGEPQHTGPKFFKAKRVWFLRSSTTSKEERAMIGERGGEGMEDVIIMRGVPILIAKEGINPRHGGSVLAISPSELAVLEVNFFEVT
jgi:hypothetical protein